MTKIPLQHKETELSTNRHEMTTDKMVTVGEHASSFITKKKKNHAKHSISGYVK